MDDHSESGSDGVDESESEDVGEREIARPVARETAARALRDLADGVAAGAVRVGEGDDALTEPVPETVDLETELEVEENEVELEVELEWARGDGEPAAVGEEAAEPADSAGDSPTESAGPETASAHAESGGDGDGGQDPDAVPVGAASGRRSQARFEVYRDRGGEWRWRLVHRNGNVIATGGEGYGRRRDARRGMESVMRNAADATVDDEGAP